MQYLTSYLCIFLVLFAGCKEENKAAFNLNFTPEQIEIFGEEIISTRLYERDMAIAPDGNEIIYTLGNYRQTLRNLVSIKKEGNQWQDKEILPFSGRYNDIEPFFSVDGTKLFFASDRPMDTDSTRTDYNIWVVDRSASAWGRPVALDTVINTVNDEFYPAVSKNNTLYFTATRTDGKGREDIFLSRFVDGSYRAPRALDSTINTTTFEFNAYISPHEDLLVFSSYGRKDGLGGGDLYFSKKSADGSWTEAKNLEFVNSDKLDYCPFIDVPRGNFYFTSDRDIPRKKRIKNVAEFEEEAHKVLNGLGNIYRVDLKKLNLE